MTESNKEINLKKTVPKKHSKPKPTMRHELIGAAHTTGKIGASASGLALLPLFTSVFGPAIASVLAPFLSAFLTEAYGAYLPRPQQDLLEKWIIELHDAILASEEKIEVLEERIKSDEQLRKIIIETTKIALRESQTEKLQLLKGAVTNSIKPLELAEQKKLRFIQYIETLSNLQIAFVKLLDRLAITVYAQNDYILTPEVNEIHKGFYNFLRMMGKDLIEDYDYCFQELKDLINKGLIREDLIKKRVSSTTASIRAVYTNSSALTPTGKQFLKFITTET